YSTAAALCSWLLLAGYFISPSTYASIGESDTLNNSGKVGKSSMKAVQNLPLVKYTVCGCSYLLHNCDFGIDMALETSTYCNHFWVKRYVAVLILTNSAMGLISTILNIYTVRYGQWFIKAVITGSIIGAWLLFSAITFIVYDAFLI
ncbi:hypothetical protein EDB80DRAFT_512594, partial [Ilyonectria destructans]